MANDFSRPRRMSKSALAVFFVKNVRGYLGLFLLCLALNPLIRDEETPHLPIAGHEGRVV